MIKGWNGDLLSLVFCLVLMWLKCQCTIYLRTPLLLKDDRTPVGFSNQIPVIVTVVTHEIAASFDQF